jgi:hypothetical protein
VVGAGLGGLALARVLGQAGLAPQMIERASGWEMAGTGIHLPANGVRALQALGLEPAVAARAVEIPRQRLLDHRGRPLAEIDLGELWGAIGPGLALSRADLHEVLRDGVPVRWAAPSGPWSGWMGRCRSPSTTTAVASSTWSSAPTGCAPRSGGWPWTVDHRSRSASTAGGSWPLSKRYALGARRDHRHHCAAQQVRELAGVGHRLVAETVVYGRSSAALSREKRRTTQSVR